MSFYTFNAPLFFADGPWFSVLSHFLVSALFFNCAFWGLIPHSHTSYQDNPLQPPTQPTHIISTVYVSIRTCHSSSVRPFISPGYRFSLNGWIPSPWHFGHHTSCLPSLHHWPFVRSNWTDSRWVTVLLFASCSASVAFLHCFYFMLASKHSHLSCCKHAPKDTSRSAISQKIPSWAKKKCIACAAVNLCLL